MTRELLESKRGTLEELERSELEAQRLEKALERVRIVGDDGGTERAVPRESSEATAPLPPLSTTSAPRRSGGGLLGALTHTFHGIVDADPEATRRNTITKTRESINQVRRPSFSALPFAPSCHELTTGRPVIQLDGALKALTQDLRYASTTIQADLDRFQRQKVADLKEMCIDYAKFHREWAAKVRFYTFLLR